MRHFTTIALFLGLSLSACGIGANTSGWHRGHVTDVSEAGLICKTYEGQIMSGTGASSVKYEFTISTTEAYQKLVDAQRSGAEVNLKYRSPFVYSLCSSSEPNFVDDVELVKN